MRFIVAVFAVCGVWGFFGGVMLCAAEPPSTRLVATGLGLVALGLVCGFVADRFNEIVNRRAP